MDFSFDRRLTMLRQMVREYAEQEVRPQLPYLMEPGEFPFELIRRMGELGLLGMIIPEKYGGTNLGHLAQIIATEELAKVYASVGQHMRACNLVPYIILNHGTEEQKQKYIPRMCTGEIMGALASTEQTGGSEPSKVNTVAKLEGDHYVVNGRKVLISRGGDSHLVAFTARTGDKISAFLVEKGTPGFMRGAKEKLITYGPRISPVDELVFKNCVIPKENLIGKEEGKGLGQVLGTIGAVGRGSGAAIGVGIATGSFEAAVSYAKQRKLYGKRLADFQAVQFSLAEMEEKIECARLLTYKCGWLLDQGLTAREVARETAMAKRLATEAAREVTIKAIDIHGGYGTSEGYGLSARLKAAMDLMAIGGTNNALTLAIARVVLERL